MRLITLILSVFIQLSIFSVGSAENARRCHMCGMDSAKSQTEFVVFFEDGSKEHACCLHCVYLLRYFIKDRAIAKIEARDFSTGSLIDAQQGYYLEGSSLIPKGSMSPFMLVFLRVEDAEKYRKKYGGSVVDFTKAMDIVKEFDTQAAGCMLQHPQAGKE